MLFRLFPSAFRSNSKLGFFAVVSFAAMTSCKSAPTAAQAPGVPGQPKVVVPTAAPIEVAPATSKALVARAITSLGANSAARFSPDGSKLLFISSSRPSHRQAQVYELDLVRMQERRVTFHDGDDQGPTYASGGAKIAYSSDTDEIKEDVTLQHVRSVYEAARANTTNPNGIRPTEKKIWRRHLSAAPRRSRHRTHHESKFTRDISDSGPWISPRVLIEPR